MDAPPTPGSETAGLRARCPKKHTATSFGFDSAIRGGPSGVALRPEVEYGKRDVTVQVTNFNAAPTQVLLTPICLAMRVTAKG